MCSCGIEAIIKGTVYDSSYHLLSEVTLVFLF